MVRGRLWRRTDPALSEEQREAEARQQVDAAKQALGERGPVWWKDGAPDYNRHLARNTPYADWFARTQGAPPQ